MGRDYKFFVRIKCRDPPTCRSFLLHFSAKKVIKHPLHSSAISSLYALKLQENVDSLTRLDLSDSTKEGTKKKSHLFYLARLSIAESYENVTTGIVASSRKKGPLRQNWFHL